MRLNFSNSMVGYSAMNRNASPAASEKKEDASKTKAEETKTAPAEEKDKGGNQDDAEVIIEGVGVGGDYILPPDEKGDKNTSRFEYLA